jgi:hypothetical protein
MAWKLWMICLAFVGMGVASVAADDDIYTYEYQSSFSGTGTHPAYQKYTFDVGLEGYFYEYQEPSINVKDEGEFGGIYFDYQYRRNADKAVQTLADAIEANDRFNILKAEVVCGR